MEHGLKLISLEVSDNPRKKYDAVFSDGTEVGFGGRGYGDYILAHDPSSEHFIPSRAKREKKRLNYIARHRVNEDWSDPKAAGTLSRYILWEYPNLKTAVRSYKRRFNL